MFLIIVTCEGTQLTASMHTGARLAVHDYKKQGTYGVPLFERSEFLIATCKKKKTDRLCVDVCMFG